MALRTRTAEIADYLHSTGIGDTEAAWKAEVLAAIATRWPDVTEVELTAAFTAATLEVGADLLDRVVKDAVNAPAR